MMILLQDLPVWSLSVLILIIMMGSLIACVCGCRRKVPRNELLGLAGVVKITDTDRYNTIELPAVGGSTSPSNLSSNASLRRAVSGAGTSSVCNARSLPDLPVEIDPSDSFAVIPNGDGTWLNNSESITLDNASELYATLEENKGTVGKKIHRIEEEYDARNRLNGTPYERIEGEHPYALVGGTIQEQMQLSNEIDGRIINVEIHNEEEVDGTINDNGHITDIPAASAISGVVPANEELPYMTPPIHENHFSGDSQDSTKGYTSITVREPIAMIQRSNVNNENVSSSRHGYYTAISDDSDEMYAAIVDPTGNIYNSGSETYAQIQPVITNNGGPRLDNPPCVSSSSVATSCNSHSRQASSSSMSSSVGNQYSPKERRQANSPLPKPPPSPSPTQLSENRDNMYAKVVKRKKEIIGCNSRDSVCSLSKEQNIVENEDKCGIIDNNECEIIKGYETIKDRKKDYETLENHFTYETILEEKLTQEKEDSSILSGYERIKEPGYEEISRNSDLDPNYEELRPQERSFNSYYATINKNKSNLSRISSEPDYASLTRGAGLYESLTDTSSSNDPNYEVLTNNNNNLQNRLINQNINETDNNVTCNDVTELYSKLNKHTEQI